MRTEVSKEIAKGFADHDTILNQRFADLSVAEENRNVRIQALEEAATEFDRSFTAWKPEIESSVSDIRLEISKLNKFFERDARANSSSQPGVLGTESAPSRQPIGSRADGPIGHHTNNHNWDDESGSLGPQTRHPVKGTSDPSFSVPHIPHDQFVPHSYHHSQGGSILAVIFPRCLSTNVTSSTEEPSNVGPRRGSRLRRPSTRLREFV
jgi:hypothetical protein